MSTPPLSVIVALRSAAALQHLVDRLQPQIAEIGGEIVVAGEPDAAQPSPWLRWVPSHDRDIRRLRALAIRAARGGVVAVGEDHVLPSADWCRAVLRAHEERPDADAVAGCMVNATDSTTAGRANFVAFAGAYAPPMTTLPDVPPPVSALSFKREVLAGLDRPGALESEVVPRLFAEGRIAADDRVRIGHDQDQGLAWSVLNAFASARTGYGTARDRTDPTARRRVLRWILTDMQRAQWRAMRGARAKNHCYDRDIPVVAAIQLAAVAGAAVGTLAGPGRAPERVA